MVSLSEVLRLLGRASGEPAGWVVVDIHGGYPTHALAPVQALVQRTDSFEALLARLELLGRSAWVEGVLVRVGTVTAGLATSHAIGRALGRLADTKRVVGYLPRVDMRSLRPGASEIIEMISYSVSWTPCDCRSRSSASSMSRLPRR